MEDSIQEILHLDPTKLTINELRSKLSQFPESRDKLPVDKKVKKQIYIELFQELQESLKTKGSQEKTPKTDPFTDKFNLSSETDSSQVSKLQKGPSTINSPIPKPVVKKPLALKKEPIEEVSTPSFSSQTSDEVSENLPPSPTSESTSVFRSSSAQVFPPSASNQIFPPPKQVFPPKDIVHEIKSSALGAAFLYSGIAVIIYCLFFIFFGWTFYPLPQANTVCDPFSSTCTVEDKGLLESAQVVLDEMFTLLQEKHGRWRCREEDNKGELESLLKAQLLSRNLAVPDFELAFRKAKELIKLGKSNYDIQFHEDSRYFFTPQFKLPFWCLFKLKIAEYKWYLGGVFFILLGILLAIQKVKQNKKLKKLVEEQAEQVRKMLQKRAQSQQKFVAVTHLRDELFPPPCDERKRDLIWNGVQEIISKDTRVSQQEELHHGAQVTVWMWTAPVATETTNTEKVEKSSPKDEGRIYYDEATSTPSHKIYPELFPPRSFRAPKSVD